MSRHATPVLCPHCGSRNPLRFHPAVACHACGRALPTIVPRTWVYVLRTLAKPLALIALLALVLYAAPQLKTLRHHLNSPAALGR